MHSRSDIGALLDQHGLAPRRDLGQNFVVDPNTVQAGMGTLAGFSAVFRGNFVVAQAGTYTFNVASQDGWIFGPGGLP